VAGRASTPEDREAARASANWLNVADLMLVIYQDDELGDFSQGNSKVGREGVLANEFHRRGITIFNYVQFNNETCKYRSIGRRSFLLPVGLRYCPYLGRSVPESRAVVHYVPCVGFVGTGEAE
jgi:hypothetical protein